MRIYTLSTKQLEQLVEMCVKLFPEYMEWKIGNTIVDSAYEYEMLAFKDYLVAKTKKEPFEFACHWYEMCIKHIAPKIQASLSDYCGCGNEEPRYEHDLNICLLLSHEHPVDFLYNEFKYIKNDKLLLSAYSY